MAKISDINIFKEAYDELNPNGMIDNSVMDKQAFNVNVTPPALIGALTGALVAAKKTKADIIKKQIEEDNAKSLNGNYYSQVQNIANGLRIFFTPFGVTYTVKNSGREVGLQTIETEDMSPDMYSAWQRKDEGFFKNLLLNKIYSDIQLAEQHFAKDFLRNQMHIQDQISKKASDDDFEIYEDVDGGEIQLLNKVAEIKEFYSKKTKGTEKLAEYMIKIMDDGTVFKIIPELDKPISKYAGFGNPLSFLGFSNDKHEIEKFTNPSYLLGKVKVGFMPDRVVFTVDDKVISTLLITRMDKESFDNFESQNKNYFISMFKSEITNGNKRMLGKIPPNMIEKKAEEQGVSQIFERVDIHPVIYFLVLTRKYTAEWVVWETEALIKILETDFELSNGISDIPLNKILCIQLVNRTHAPYMQSHAFEKVVRGINGKSIDFEKREVDDMTMEDLAFALDVLLQVTPHEDIYEKFSREVFDHIIEILLADECKIYMPEHMETPGEEEFLKELNEGLLEGNSEQDTNNVESTKMRSSIIKNNEIISHVGIDIIKKLYTIKKEHHSIDIEKFIDVLLQKLSTNVDMFNSQMIKLNIIRNIEVAEYIDGQRKLLKSQTAEFAL